MIKRAYNWIVDKAKRFWKKTLIVLGVGAVALAATTGGPALDASSIQDKYDLATEIKAEYTLDNTALIKEAVDENSIKIKIGDEKSAEFVPELYISRWEDEVWFKIKPKIGDVKKKDQKVKLEGDKIKFETPKIDYHFYDLGITPSHSEGAYEFEVILKEKPATNVITFDIETSGLNFYYQPPLDEEYASSSCTSTNCGGEYRPENVVGSYVVYHKTKGGMNSSLERYEYRTGQFGIIYRPKITDAEGNWVWESQVIDVENGTITLTIPQDFIDNAVYPIRSTGETFGYTTVGGTRGYYINLGETLGVKGVLGENGTLSKYSVYLSSYIASNIKAALYTLSGGTQTYEANSGAVGSVVADEWTDIAISLAVTADTYYIMVVAENSTGSRNFSWRNTGASGSGEYWGGGNYAAFPNATKSSNAVTWLTSIYATYSPPAPPAEAPVEADDFIMITY